MLGQGVRHSTVALLVFYNLPLCGEISRYHGGEYEDDSSGMLHCVK
jgi:hypothetical protein